MTVCSNVLNFVTDSQIFLCSIARVNAFRADICPKEFLKASLRDEIMFMNCWLMNYC